MTRDLELRRAFVELAEVLRVHLSDHENLEDCIRFGPSPSDDVRELIGRVMDVLDE